MDTGILTMELNHVQLGRTIVLIEVKKDDFKQGFAQVTVQMESSLSCKCKADEIDGKYDIDKV